MVLGGFRSFHVLVLTAATCNKTGHITVGQRKRSFFFAFDTDPLSFGLIQGNVGKRDPVQDFNSSFHTSLSITASLQ